MVSINQVANLAGVSNATVSRCINSPLKVSEDTRKRVQAAIEETGYAVNTLAQSFRRGRTNMVMVVVPSVGDPFFTKVMLGIRTAAKRCGYTIMINETQLNTFNADEVGALMVSRQADGIILLASLSPFGTEMLSAPTSSHMPIVIGCETVSKDLSAYPSVHIDNISAAFEATEYLRSQGHENIAFISGPESSLLTKDREGGYKDCMSSDEVTRDFIAVEDGEMSIGGAIRATRKLLNQTKRPTAIFCANDEMAMGAMHEIKNQGLKIPSDVSVVGFDDIRYAEITDPPLTTIYQPAEEIGERTFYRLLRSMDTGNLGSQRSEIVPHKLIVRNSVSKR
jgi:LacI family repressor for deo operon, udp, cdd, tsx, nupC, and nupG